MACGCSGNCTCEVDEINTSCASIAPSIILPPCEPVAIEEKCPKVVIKDFRAAFLTNANFNLPSCGSSVEIQVIDPPILHVGAYIWNAIYGAFQVVSFTETSIKVLNRCFTPVNYANPASGTAVPKGTAFIEIADPTFSDIIPQVFLMVDFTIPPVGYCVPARFTSLEGIPIGGQVSFGGGTYWLTNDLGGGLVQLCNTGSGGTPGDVLIAVNFSLGDYQYPVSLSSSSIVMESESSVTGTFDDGTGVFGPQSIGTSLIISNPLFNKPLSVSYKFVGTFSGVSRNNNPTVVSTGFENSLVTTEDGDVTSKDFNVSYISSASIIDNYRSFQISQIGIVLVPPNTTILVSSFLNFSWQGSLTPGETTLSGTAKIRGTAFGVFSN